MRIPYSTLVGATNGFREKLGSGGFAEVFKGFYEGKDIAVKKFYPTLDVDDTMFRNEFANLQGVRHRHIVRSVGYCYETVRDFVEHDGKIIVSKQTYRMLCFEYLQRGSLEENISKESLGDNWWTHFQIITGICEGLLYLHEGCKVPIFHLDLKPANILLDQKMVPKLADFGLSRLFHEPQTHITKDAVGTRKYMAPEFLSQKQISCKNDVFSLGIIIIEVMAGPKGYSTFFGMSSAQEHEQFIQNVCDTWRERLSNMRNADVYFRQVQKCIKIAVECVHTDKDKRPTIRAITEILRSLATEDQKIAYTSKDHVYPIDGEVSQEVDKDFAPLGRRRLEQDFAPSRRRRLEQDLCAAKESESITLMSPGSIVKELIDIYPTVLLFRFELNKRSKCRLSISNKTDSDIQFFIDPKNYPDWYIHENRLSGFVHSHFTCAFHVVMKERKRHPRGNDEFELYLKRIRHRRHLDIVHQRHLDMYDDESDHSNNLDVDGGMDKNATLRGSIMFRDPDPVARQNEFGLRLDDETFGSLTSMDVHPTKEWIIVGYEGGHICIWMNLDREGEHPEGVHDYRTIVTEGIACRSVKFIVCREWVVSGHSNGVILVHTNSDEPKQVVKLEAHEGAVTSLAVHPTQPLVLSSSDDGSIKLWNWNDEGWSCTRKFRQQKGPVLQLAFNPKDASTFATVTTLPRTVKIWSIDSDDPVKIWIMKVESIAYFTGNHRCYMAISMQEGRTKIMNVESMTYIHALQILDVESETSSLLVPARATAITAVACHPKYPIIVTGTSDGNVYLWDYTTYRLKESLCFGDDTIKGFGFIGIEEDFASLQHESGEQGNGKVRHWWCPGSYRLLIRYVDRIEFVDLQWERIMMDDPYQR